MRLPFAKVLASAVVALLSVPPSFALRFAFTVANKAGTPISGAEVCIFPSSDESPLKRWFGSDDIRCFPADTIMAFPSGHWNVFARRAGKYASSFPLAVPIFDRPENTDTGFRRVELQVEVAATVALPQNLLTSPAERLAVYFPTTAVAPSFVIPAVQGKRSLDIPAGASFVPLLVREGKITRLGNVHPPAAPGQAIELSEFGEAAPRDRRDVIGYVMFSRLPVEFRATRPLPEPIIVMRAGESEHYDPLPTPAAMRSGDLLFFKGIPAHRTRASIDAEGPTWLDRKVGVSLASGEQVVTAGPLELVPAAEVDVVISAAAREWLMPLSTASCHLNQRADRDNSIEISDCGKTPCAVVRREPILDAWNKDVIFERIPVGLYKIAVHTIARQTPWTWTMAMAAGRQSVQIEPPGNTLTGILRIAGAPAKARITAGDGNTLADETGTYVLRTNARSLSEISVDLCDRKVRFVVVEDVPLQLNAVRDIELPQPTRVLVVADGDGPSEQKSARPIGGAILTVTVPGRNADEPLRLSAAGGRTDENGVAELATTPLHDFAICADAEGYARACTHPEKQPALVKIALHAVSTTHGSIAGVSPVKAGLLFAVTIDGQVTEVTLVKEDGAFLLQKTHGAMERLLFISANHPLALIAYPLGSLEGLVFPSVPSRSFVVRIQSKQDAEVGVAVGGTIIPNAAWSRHQAFRGLATTTSNGALSVRDIVESGPITVFRGFASGTKPPSAPAGSDAFTQPQYRSTFPQKTVAGSTEVVFD